MEQIFEQIGKRLYKRQYQTGGGDWVTLYYARFKCRLKRRRRFFPLGSEIAAAKDKLQKLEAQDVDLYDFDADRQRAPMEKRDRDGKAEAFTFDEWAERYPTFDDVKRKRSLADELRIIKLHLKPFFGAMTLTTIEREDLSRYVYRRADEKDSYPLR